MALGVVRRRGRRRRAWCRRASRARGDGNWLPAARPGSRARSSSPRRAIPAAPACRTIQFAAGAPAARRRHRGGPRARARDATSSSRSSTTTSARLATDPPNMWITGWIADYVGPNDFLGVLLESDSSNNYGRLVVAGVRRRPIADALATRDPAAAQAAYERALAEIQREVPVVPLYVEHGLGALARRPARGGRQRPRHPAHGGHGVGAMSAALARGAVRRSRLRCSLRCAASRRRRPRSPPTRPSSAATATATFGDVHRRRAGGHAPERRRRGSRRSSAPATDARTFLAEIADARRRRRRPCATRYQTPFGSLYPEHPRRARLPGHARRRPIVDGPTTTRPLRGRPVRLADARGRRSSASTGTRATTRSGSGRSTSASEAVEDASDAPRRRRDATRSTSTSTRDRDAFYDVIGPALQENVGGLALAEIRTLFANIAPSRGQRPVGRRSWCPHELTHLVFDTATQNPYHEPPHWLNEGLADYLAAGLRRRRRGPTSSGPRATGDLMPLRALVGAVPVDGRPVQPRLRRERLRDRLPGPDVRPGRAGQADPELRRRRQRRRRVQRRARRRHRRVRGRAGWPTSASTRRRRSGRSRRRPARCRRAGTPAPAPTPRPGASGPVATPPAVGAGWRRRRRRARMRARASASSSSGS